MIRIRRLTERSEGIFAFLCQFPTDLERSAGCQQSIFFLHINEQIIFSPQIPQFGEQIIFLRKNYPPPPPGIKWSAPNNFVIRWSTIWSEFY